MKHRNKISTFSYDQANMVYCLSHLMAIFVTIVNIMRKIFLQNSFFKKNYLITLAHHGQLEFRLWSHTY